MKNESLYNRTVSILVDAYFNDTLQHGNQCGCAVGNLVADGMSIKLKRLPRLDIVVPEYWNRDHVTENKTIKNNGLWYNNLRTPEEKLISLVNKQVVSTGYSALELLEIERAFEGADHSYDKDTFMFNGLMKVIKCLDEIHENNDTEITTQSKKRFQKQLA